MGQKTLTGCFSFIIARACVRTTTAAVLVLAFVASAPLLHASTPSTRELKNENPAKRIEAIAQLKAIRTADVSIVLHQALVSETEPNVQLALMDAIGAMPEFGRAEPFAKFLNDALPPLRKRAAYTLGLIGGKKPEQLLRQALLRESDPAVKAMLLQSLSVCASPESLPDLQRAAQDSRPEVRLKAQEAIGALVRPEPKTKPEKGKRSK